MAATLARLEASGVALAVIDTPPFASAEIAAIVAQANLVVVPVVPSPHDLRAIAQSLTAQAGRPPFVPELAMRAARAWLAAGESGFARHFSRLVLDSAAASEDERRIALEILDSTRNNHATARPPQVDGMTGEEPVATTRASCWFDVGPFIARLACNVNGAVPVFVLALKLPNGELGWVTT